ncbi:MAG: ABC transporter substrate-binding protein [Bacteroidota bacterium]
MKKIWLTSLFVLAFLVSAFAQDTRIVTAGSIASEIVCALGHQESIVSTDRTSTFPAELQKLPSIGYRNGISAEGIISQEPDLVIFESGYLKPEVAQQLISTGIKTIALDQKYSLESTQKMIAEVATELDKKSEGKKLAAQMEKDFKALAKDVAKTESRPTVLFVYARGTGNMSVIGTDSFASLLEKAGCTNAVPTVEGYKPLNAESLIEANPTYILFFTSGLASVGGKEGALQITGVSETTAGKKGNIIDMDGVMLTNWGPRAAKAARMLFEMTHPTAK